MILFDHPVKTEMAGFHVESITCSTKNILVDATHVIPDNEVTNFIGNNAEDAASNDGSNVKKKKR